MGPLNYYYKYSESETLNSSLSWSRTPFLSFPNIGGMSFSICFLARLHVHLTSSSKFNRYTPFSWHSILDSGVGSEYANYKWRWHQPQRRFTFNTNRKGIKIPRRLQKHATGSTNAGSFGANNGLQ